METNAKIALKNLTKNDWNPESPQANDELRNAIVGLAEEQQSQANRLAAIEANITKGIPAILS